MDIEIRPGRTIHVSFLGNHKNDTTVFFIHGLGARSEQWRQQIDLLKEHNSLVLFDLFGLGESEKPRPTSKNPYSFSELDLDLRALFSRYANKNNIVIGHSYGGALGVSLAFDFQDQISKLILINPTTAEPKTKLPAIFKLPTFILQLFGPQLEKAFNKGGYDKSTDPQLIQEENNASRKNKMYVIKAMVTGMETIRKVDVSQLPMPVLIILGETDNIISPDKTRQFYQQIPNHEIYTITNAAHMVMLEQPQETNELIKSFLTHNSP